MNTCEGHVFYRISPRERVCGFCNLRQVLEVKQVWIDDGKVAHNFVHQMKEDGTLVYDSFCEKCRIAKEIIGE